MSDSDTAFTTSVSSIIEIYGQYSVFDIARSLFVSHLWLPNISSDIKHKLLTSIFAALSPENFSKEDRINKYEDFVEFLQKIYPKLPSFDALEDYIP